MPYRNVKSNVSNCQIDTSYCQTACLSRLVCWLFDHDLFSIGAGCVCRRCLQWWRVNR